MRQISLLAVAATAALALLISYLTLAEVRIPRALPQSDKLHHMLAFAALAVPIALARPRWLVLAIPAFAGFGWLIEVVQPYFGRDRDLMDWYADLAGIGCGVAVGLIARLIVLRLRPAQSALQSDLP